MQILIYFFTLTGLFFLQSGANMVLKVKHDFFTLDNLGNIFFVNDEELFKYSSQGTQLARYSNLKLGPVTSVDASNPLKILVYYRDYQQLVFLDNQLSSHGKTISLQDLGFEQASLVCTGANGSFWVYERRNNELLRFDQNAKKIASTGNLRQVLSEEIEPVLMKEQNNYLYLACRNSGIYVFDIFGAFSKLLPLEGVTSLEVNQDILYYFRQGKLCSFDQRLIEESCDSLNVRGLKQARVQGNYRYRSFGDSLVISPLAVPGHH